MKRFVGIFGFGDGSADYEVIAACLDSHFRSKYPLLIAFGQSGRFLGSVIAGTAAFFIVLGWTIEPLGLIGIGLAHIAFELVWSGYGWITARLTLHRTQG